MDDRIWARKKIPWPHADLQIKKIKILSIDHNPINLILCLSLHVSCWASSNGDSESALKDTGHKDPRWDSKCRTHQRRHKYHFAWFIRFLVLYFTFFRLLRTPWEVEDYSLHAKTENYRELKIVRFRFDRHILSCLRAQIKHTSWSFFLKKNSDLIYSYRIDIKYIAIFTSFKKKH